MSTCDHQTESLIGHLNDGENWAPNALLSRVEWRLRAKLGQMLTVFPTVQRRMLLDDLHQDVMIRLLKAMKTVVFENKFHFYRLAAKKMRQELLDMSRKLSGTATQKIDHEFHPCPEDVSDARAQCGDVETLTHNPENLAYWTEVHERIETLDEESREMFELRYYQGLSAVETAETLGISREQADRRWRDAKVELCVAMGNDFPDLS